MKKPSKGFVGKLQPESYIAVHASMADVLILAQEMQKTDKTLKFNKELLEFILREHFGFDSKKNVFTDFDEKQEKVFNWYETHNCTHRSKITNEVVTCDRFMGAERMDKDWYESDMMSMDAWKLYKGV